MPIVKTNLSGEDELLSGGGSSVVVDTEFSTKSKNPLANSTTTAKFNEVDTTLSSHTEAISSLNTELDAVESNFLTSSKSVYVDATNGSDETGDGTQANPWATIQKAVDMCPSSTSKYFYYIYIANGTYDSIEVTGSKNILFMSIESEQSIIIKGIYVGYNAFLDIKCKITIDISDVTTASHGIVLYNASMYIGKPLTIIGNGVDKNRIGLYANVNSLVTINDTITVSNFFRGVQVGYSSLVYCDYYNISDCTYGLYAAGDLILGNIGSMTNVTNLYSEVNGGRIKFGSGDFQLIGSVTGANSVAIDSDLYTEFLVEITYDNLIFGMIIPINDLTSNAKYYRNGSYYSSAYYYDARAKATLTSISNYLFYATGKDVTASSTMTVYGRRC